MLICLNVMHLNIYPKYYCLDQVSLYVSQSVNINAVLVSYFIIHYYACEGTLLINM